MQKSDATGVVAAAQKADSGRSERLNWITSISVLETLTITDPAL